jgi:hypothetical protein
MKPRYVHLAFCVGVVLTLSFLATVYWSHASPSDPSEASASAVHKIHLPLVQGKPVVDLSLNVTPGLDVGRAVSATIPLAGGQITAIAANNTRFTLTIPANTLVETTTFTLTPVAQITGLPDVQLVGAVQIEPLGLLLMQGALLKIEPAQAVPVPREYPFAYYRNGKDFHPYPIQPYSKGLVYPLGEFEGGYGIAMKATQASTASASAPPFTPLDPEAQMRARMAALLQQERERQLVGLPPDPTLWPKVRDLALEYYNTIIKPTLQPSTTDCATAKANMGNAVGWLRQITLLFGDTREPEADPAFAAAGEEIIAAWTDSIKNCYFEAWNPCVNWDNLAQIKEVFTFYRELLLLGVEAGVTDPARLPECTVVDVTLQGGSFHYTFQPNVWGNWDRAVLFQFTDDSVSGVGIYQPFRRKGSSLPDAKAVISMTVMIDGVWQPVSEKFFCRDLKAQRVQELWISVHDVEGEPALPPQLYADNIGCWRWTGSMQHDNDWKPTSSLAEYYQHTSGQLTMEPDPKQRAYNTWVSEGKVKVDQRYYRLVAPSVVNYDEKLHQVVDGKTTCMQTLSAHITDPWNYASPNYYGIRLPNAGWSLPRDAFGSVEMKLHLPYTTQGTCPGTYLEGLSVKVGGNLSADGKHILYHETGSLPEGMGTFSYDVDLQAWRE